MKNLKSFSALVQTSRFLFKGSETPGQSYDIDKHEKSMVMGSDAERQREEKTINRIVQAINELVFDKKNKSKLSAFSSQDKDDQYEIPVENDYILVISKENGVTLRESKTGNGIYISGAKMGMESFKRTEGVNFNGVMVGSGMSISRTVQPLVADHLTMLEIYTRSALEKIEKQLTSDELSSLEEEVK